MGPGLGNADIAAFGSGGARALPSRPHPAETIAKRAGAMRGAGLDNLCFGVAPCNFHRTPFWIADRHRFAGQPETGMRRGGMLDRVARAWLAIPVAHRRTE